MEIFLIRLLQFVLAISLLVFLHEGGHMFFSKLFGIRVEKFFIFFDMSIGKWSGKLFSFKPKTSDTEYGVGWLPLGGASTKSRWQSLPSPGSSAPSPLGSDCWS